MPCEICQHPYENHTLWHNGRFRLSCPDVPGPVRLGATAEAAAESLSARCGPEIAEGLWRAFGSTRIEHRIFELAKAKHVASQNCDACPRGWPAKCTDHGGCPGYLHLTLWHARNGRIYTMRSELPVHEVRNAYRNLLVRGRFEQPRPTPYRATAECGHCGSHPSANEVSRVLINFPVPHEAA